MTVDIQQRDGPAYANQLAQLLPRGAAWEVAPDSLRARLLEALAEEFARIDGRGGALLDEADPRTTLELLPDWERVAGLPDSCTGAPDSVQERQVALREKLTGVAGQNAAAFIEAAARIGYVITIEEHRPARMGMRLGERLNGADWAYTWTARISPFDSYLEEASFLAQARLGDRLGVRLRGFGALDVECVIRRMAPAHTIVLFAYDVEPTAAMWMDFTA
ncbi:MAG: DUF2313 domain-containing protein [Sphingomonadales bacterium]|nr:DUF2313 domain-containing protein [Sphingomonadales bacterium]MBD3772133.1 DUF2313 domain-containing protein [Paracoccaceae bacterium]